MPPPGPGAPYGPQPPMGMGGPPLAGVGARFAARLLDLVIVTVIAVVVSIPLIAGAAQQFRDAFQGTDSFNVQLDLTWPFLLVYFAYDLLLTYFWNGQTLGKRAAGIRVIAPSSGRRPEIGHQALRTVIFVVPGAIPCLGQIFWLINVLWCTWDKPYQQCLHDKPARTIVVSAH